MFAFKIIWTNPLVGSAYLKYELPNGTPMHIYPGASNHTLPWKSYDGWLTVHVACMWWEYNVSPCRVSALLAPCEGNHRRQVESPHKGSVMQSMPHEICTRIRCIVLWCGYVIMFFIYSYISRLNHIQKGIRMIAQYQWRNPDKDRVALQFGFSKK